MRLTIFFILNLAMAGALPAQTTRTSAALAARAKNVTITRDTWGIPHVSGKTDADVVFGVMYAQAEDDFNRIETNYLNAMGRLAEAEGAGEIYRDLRMKLYIDPAEMNAKYASSPAWLKRLMDAYADGLNYYLQTHPAVKPRVITRFEPWMALTFSEGSIGGDIERIDLAALRAFYERPRVGSSASIRLKPDPTLTGSIQLKPDPTFAGSIRLKPDSTFAGVGSGFSRNDYVEPSGSNGIALSPAVTASKHAMLLINPHTSFFFRAEAQMTSEEGLNAYGAITWGQFFVYQGFNDRAGWMHTSSGVDNIDEYAETIEKRGRGFVYRYGSGTRPVTTSTITVPYKTANGLAQRTFTVYRTHHGPIVREANGKWISVRMMQEPVKALMQSYSRTKARSYQAFRESMELHTNSSNNTVYADADGTIAYFHANFIPKRSIAFDWTKPVDGSNPATEWGALLSIDESPGLKNPPSGWLYNSNNWPWSAAGPSSQKRGDFPAYVERGVEESARGYHALRVLTDKKDFTIDSLLAAAYDSYLPAFAMQLPALLEAWDRAAADAPLKVRLADPIALLRGWDFRWSTESVPTALAIYWGEEAARLVAADARHAGISTDTFIATKRAAPGVLLQALDTAVNTLARDFGSWKTTWGTINRYQRINGDIVQRFDDNAASIPVGFTSSRWGSLASFGARTYSTKKMYGTTGNSFVAIVEFGDRIQARAVSAGGQSGDLRSPHFSDQAARYATGDLREVYFHPDQLDAHVERRYHPGE
jgi:acyl-homoserine-lactone acylase